MTSERMIQVPESTLRLWADRLKEGGSHGWEDRVATVMQEMLAAPPAAAHGDSFRTWLAAEMPAGTVIGDPSWWAERILKRIGDAAHGDEAVRKNFLLGVGE